ncbi:MAG: leucine-rich repeat domain-containing protein, partial [Thermoguttaceae bacterium]|nr:leucine-rich repeat domain-containing protein [Thermoguttaceae bacterium]
MDDINKYFWSVDFGNMGDKRNSAAGPKRVFGSFTVKSPDFPNMTDYIHDGAYLRDSTLASIVLSGGVAHIGKSAFEGCCFLTSAELSQFLLSIGPRAFAYCISLPSIVIPRRVETIGDEAFFRCSSLNLINIPASVSSIGRDVFRGCSSLKWIDVELDNDRYRSDYGVLFTRDGKRLIAYPVGRPCKRYAVPDGVTHIDARAFEECREATSIFIPASVTEIGEDAFFNCRSLKNIQVDRDNSRFCSVGGVLFTKDEKTLIAYPAGKTRKKYAVRDGVERIERNAFGNCRFLTSIKIAKSVKEIGARA